jgi:hypothetical protein
MGTPVTVGTNFVLADPIIIVDTDGNYLFPAGTGKIVRVEKTRPGDTNAYAINDAINESASAGSNWTFAVGRAVGGSGQIVAMLLATDQAANVARYELDLYDTNPTAINDNAEATRLYANQGTYLGTITSGAAAKKTANSTASEALVGCNVPFKCTAASLNIFGILRTLDAFSPAASQKVQITLSVVQM